VSQSQPLTIQQVIARAKKAVKKGDVATAIQLYNAVLQHDPYHAFAKKSLRKLQKGLPSGQAQSAGIVEPPQKKLDVLADLYHSAQMASAEQVCRELLDTYPQSLVVTNILAAALQGQGKLQEAVANYDKLIGLKPDFVEAYSNRGSALKELGHLKEAVDSCSRAIKLNPEYPEAYSNRGNALQGLGKVKQAIGDYDKAIQLKPDFTDAYSNRGVALQELGLGEAAIESYDKVIQLNPRYAVAYANRGVALQGLGRQADAVENYDKAIQLKPDYADAYSNRGNALKHLGQMDAAIASHQKAISINPENSSFWASFADVMQVVQLTSYSDDLGRYLLQVLEQSIVRPKDISLAVISALRCHPIMLQILEQSKSNSIDGIVDQLTEQLSTISLLLRIMELTPIADLDVERLFVKMRRAMLRKAVSGGDETQGLPFYAALAMHCFTNEYIFLECKEEMRDIELLQKLTKNAVEKNEMIPQAWIAILGAYRPLNSFSWMEYLREYEWSSDLKKVIVRQVNDVERERVLRSEIPCLTSIDDKVSLLVQDQYEENPYPRWVNAGLSSEPKSLRQVLRTIKLDLDFGAHQFPDEPDILIAGCGTGQQALSTASLYSNCHVLAVDLSLSSLSYAMRKTEELGVTNIEYMQGDILKLNQLDREFDIIESAGVLHHMDDPVAGWRVLVGMLRAGGVMKIALYSELARQCIVEARRQIAEKKYTASSDDIRRYREELSGMDIDPDSEIHKVITSSDFYSLSECRDLLFHVQEHRFTLIQIEEALKVLGLKFIGFELKHNVVRSKFSELYREKDDLVSLPLWHQFELKNPDTFNGMYQFWVQKA